VEENNKKIDELTRNVEAKDQEINQLQADLLKAKQETQTHVDSLAETQNQAATASADLQRQVDGLKAENDDLINRLKAANTAIMNALQSLDRLSDEAVNQQNMQNVNAAFAEVEKSLMEINAAIQGASSPSSAAPTSGTLPSSSLRLPIPPNTLITVNQINGPPFQISYGELINQLKERARLPNGRGKKYQDALDGLINITNPNEVPSILNKFINFKNEKVFGGKKSKSITKKNKNKKQKGGFHYKTSSRRKSLITSFKKN
jgi:ABC-type transporter Mla subunit MlaD